MASLILVVGFMGLIEAVTISSGMMDTARRQTLAAQILNHELERLRFKTWDEIKNLTPNSAIDPQFNQAIAASGATFTLSGTVTDVTTDHLLREVTYTVTWKVKTSRHDDSGGVVVFEYKRSNSAYFGKYGLNLSYQRS